MFKKRNHWFLLTLAVCGCDINPHVSSEVPVFDAPLQSVTPVISWTPATAMSIRMYAGEKDLDTYGAELVWRIDAADGRNTIRAPVRYGDQRPDEFQISRAPARLRAGQPYTVVIQRYDRRGSGGGFTNTHNTYKVLQTFIP